MAWIVRIFAAFFTKGVPRLAGGAIQGVLVAVSSTAVMWIFRGLVSSFPDTAKFIGTKVVQAYYAGPDWWGSFVKAYLENLTGADVSEAFIPGNGVPQFGRAAMQNMGHAFMEPMLGLLMPQGELTPEEGKRGAERYLGVNFQFQMHAWLLHVIGDMWSFGVFKSLKDLPNAISWSYGLGWLSWLVMGTPFQMIINKPFEQLINSTYLPSLPTFSQAIDMYLAGDLPDIPPAAGANEPWYDTLSPEERAAGKGTLIRLAKYNGWRSEWLTAFVNRAAKRTSVSEVNKLYKRRIWDKETTRKTLKKQGNHDGTIETLFYLWDTERLWDLIDAVGKEFLDLYIVGDIDWADVLGHFTTYGYSQEEIKLLKIEADLRKRQRAIFSDSELIRFWRKKIITRSNLEIKLRARGFEDAEVDQLLLDAVKKTPPADIE